MFKTILGTQIYLETQFFLLKPAHSTKNFKPSYKFSKLSYKQFHGNFEFPSLYLMQIDQGVHE